MVEQTKEEIQAAITSLDGFVQQLYWGEDLTSEQSKKNIEEGLIQIITYRSDSLMGTTEIGYSNGLLITEDGYFLTAKHCIYYKFHTGVIKDREGKVYSIEKTCAVSKDESEDSTHRYDVALAKAKIEGPSRPKKYRLFNTNQLEPNLSVELLFYDENGKFGKKYGIVKHIKDHSVVDLGNGKVTPFANHFVTRLGIPAKRGNSGGIIVSPDGRIVGIASTADVSGVTNRLGGIKLFKALELIAFHKRVLINKLSKLA